MSGPAPTTEGQKSGHYNSRCHTPKTCNENSSPKPGDLLLQRFILLHKLGIGGSAAVFCARDSHMDQAGEQTNNTAQSPAFDQPSNRDIAIKICHHKKTPHCQNSNVLMHELAVTRGLNHPNLVKIYDYHSSHNTAFLTMELIHGQNLKQITQLQPTGALDYSRIKRFIEPVVAALGSCHRVGIIHSDVKPDNILVADDGRIKLIDFASARQRQAPPQTTYHTYTLAYASPQLLKDAEATVGDDIYSLACVIYELLSGQQANANQMATKVLSQKVRGQSTQPATGTSKRCYRPSKQRHKPVALSHWQWHLLQKAMSEGGCQRFSSIAHFWWWFKLTSRTATALILVGLLSTALLSHASYWAYQRAVDRVPPLNDNQTDHYSDWAIDNQLTAAIDYADQKKQPLEDRLNRLAQWLEQQPAIDSSSTAHSLQPMARAKQGLINELDQQLSSLLSYDTGGAETPQFHHLHKLLLLAHTVFPDSLRIQQMREALNQEQQQYADLLRISYRNLWQNCEHSIPEAIAINSLLRHFRALDLTLPDDTRPAEQRLIETMQQAIARSDYRHYFELHSFAQTITEHPLLPELLQQFDVDYINGADQLLDYPGLVAENTKDYPIQAAKKWLQPRLVEINSALTQAWKDRELNALASELEQLADDFKTGIYNPAFQQTLALLREKYRIKLKFYKARGFNKSRANLQVAFARLSKGEQHPQGNQPQ